MSDENQTDKEANKPQGDSPGTPPVLSTPPASAQPPEKKESGPRKILEELDKQAADQAQPEPAGNAPPAESVPASKQDQDIPSQQQPLEMKGTEPVADPEQLLSDAMRRLDELLKQIKDKQPG